MPRRPKPLGEMLLPQPGAQRVLAHHDLVSDLAAGPISD
jgi:hypothetical protein